VQTRVELISCCIPDEKIQYEWPGKEVSKNQEEVMARLSVVASLLLSLV